MTPALQALVQDQMHITLIVKLFTLLLGLLYTLGSNFSWGKEEGSEKSMDFGISVPWFFILWNGFAPLLEN